MPCTGQCDYLRHVAVKSGVDNVHVFPQIYKCVKSKYLDDRPSPVASLGVLVTRREAVWFVEYLWHKEECNGSITWQLEHCHVAPEFSAPHFPSGPLVATLHLQLLEDRRGHIGLSEFMFMGKP